MNGALLIAVVFLASGATMVSNARNPAPEGEAPRGGFSAMPVKRKLGFGIFLLFLGALFAVYWLVSRG